MRVALGAACGAAGSFGRGGALRLCVECKRISAPLLICQIFMRSGFFPKIFGLFILIFPGYDILEDFEEGALRFRVGIGRHQLLCLLLHFAHAGIRVVYAAMLFCKVY